MNSVTINTRMIAVGIFDVESFEVGHIALQFIICRRSTKYFAIAECNGIMSNNNSFVVPFDNDSGFRVELGMMHDYPITRSRLPHSPNDPRTESQHYES